MHDTLATLIDLLETSHLRAAGVIPWGSPVPAFGDPNRARVATLGLNPSNREFLDSVGNELDGRLRRFHTLNSLGLHSWAEADARHIQEIIYYCHEYFQRNPYDRWFRVLDHVLRGAGVSYYGGKDACHLDLIPFATKGKWMQLTLSQRRALLTIGVGALTQVLVCSPIRVLILNGRSVVSHFEKLAGIALRGTRMPHWSLPRQSGQPVRGFAYRGYLRRLCRQCLGREVLVLGYNHNLQSSFGVTNGVRREIRRWVSDSLVAEDV